MKRIVTLAALALAATTTAIPASAQHNPAASGQASTIFAKGPEVHLMPSFAPVGSKISVVGLGFRAGSQIKVLYGPPNSEYDPRPLARAIAGANGRFVTSFTVTRAFARGKIGHPLVIGAMPGSGPGAATAFFITPV